MSLAHGWSAGPTAWLMEEVLGIKPTGAGFSTVKIRPDLVDLAWAKGAEPTPHGLLSVSARQEGTGTIIAVDIPQAVTAEVSVPVASESARVLVNGSVHEASPDEGKTRKIVALGAAGHYELRSE